MILNRVYFNFAVVKFGFGLIKIKFDSAIFFSKNHKFNILFNANAFKILSVLNSSSLRVIWI